MKNWKEETDETHKTVYTIPTDTFSSIDFNILEN